MDISELISALVILWVLWELVVGSSANAQSNAQPDTATDGQPPADLSLGAPTVSSVVAPIFSSINSTPPPVLQSADTVDEGDTQQEGQPVSSVDKLKIWANAIFH